MKNGNYGLLREVYYIHGNKHNDKGPASIRYHNYPNDIECYKYYEHGRIHRCEKEGPAYIRYYENGTKLIIYYYYGNKHRSQSMIGNNEGAAEIMTDKYGNLIYECYYFRGSKHRIYNGPETKPAEIHYYWDSDSKQFNNSELKIMTENYYNCGKLKS